MKKARTEAVMVYGNHGENPGVIEDMMLLLEDAFRDSGIKLRFSPNVEPGELNVFLEFFSALGYVGDMIRIKEENPDTDYVCIPTEMIAKGRKTFNDFAENNKWTLRRIVYWTGNRYFVRRGLDVVRYFASLVFRKHYKQLATKLRKNPIANMYLDEKAAQNHYTNRPYWQRRYDAFEALVPHFKAIWCMSDFQHEAYKKAFDDAPNLLRMPVVSFQKEPRVKHPTDIEKDIDFMFTGTMTSYRQYIVDELKKRGFKVFSGPPNLPTFLREHLLKRTKISLDIRQSKGWTASSPLRLHQLMLQGAFVAAEYGGMPCHQEKFVAIVQPDTFIDECEALIKQGEFAKRGTEQFHNYNNSLEPQREQMRTLIQEAAYLPKLSRERGITNQQEAVATV